MYNVCICIHCLLCTVYTVYTVYCTGPKLTQCHQELTNKLPSFFPQSIISTRIICFGAQALGTYAPSPQVPQTIMSEWTRKGNLYTTHLNAQQWTITTQSIILKLAIKAGKKWNPLCMLRASRKYS